MIDDLRITLPCLFVPCTKHEHFVSCGERKRCPPKLPRVPSTWNLRSSFFYMIDVLCSGCMLSYKVNVWIRVTQGKWMPCNSHHCVSWSRIKVASLRATCQQAPSEVSIAEVTSHRWLCVCNTKLKLGVGWVNHHHLRSLFKEKASVPWIKQAIQQSAS